jgi:formamidopyrimidine-DNA glycosylase
MEAISRHLVGRRLDRVRLISPFVLRSVEPRLEAIESRVLHGIQRVGKRLALAFPDELYLVFHLMIAGRLRWAERTPPPAKTPRVSAKLILAQLDFEHGTLSFTEAGSKKRASMQVVQGTAALGALDSGGIEPLLASHDEFRAAIVRENHTLKRALTDPHLFSGIGNAYSDEILHAARLSPLQHSRTLTDEQVLRLHSATRQTLTTWVERLRHDAGGRFPEKVTAFREEMAVHGRFRQPCPVCHTPVQRIVYADNECNYCPRCQTGGRLLADRSLSRLLKADWPRQIE